MQQTVTLSRKGRRMAAKAAAKARKAAAQEAAEEAAVQAAVEAARLKRENNMHCIPTCTVTIKAVSPSKKGALQTAETLDESPKETQVSQENPAGKSMSKQAIKNRRKRANRRARNLLAKQDKEEVVSSPSTDAVVVESQPIAAVTINDDVGSDLPTDKDTTATLVERDEVPVTKEAEEADKPKWLRSTAQLVWVESMKGKEHEFYQGEELSTHEKVYCVLNSIDQKYLSHDGCQRQVELEDWRDWEELCSPCKQNPENGIKTYIHQLPFIGINNQETAFYQTMDENLQYHTFTSDGVPIYAAQMLAWHESERNKDCRTLADFEALMETKKMELAKYEGIRFGADGNPWAETLSTIERGGVVYRGKPRTVQIRVLVPESNMKDGTSTYTYTYTRPMLAYKSFYRVMSTVDKEVYHYGGEHLFYQSGQPSLHLYGNLQPGIDALEELAFFY